MKVGHASLNNWIPLLATPICTTAKRIDTIVIMRMIVHRLVINRLNLEGSKRESC